MSFRFSIDRGGTFTDVYAETPDQKGFRVVKLLSEDPSNYPDAPREGIRRVLEKVTGKPYPRDAPLDASEIEFIRMGTTVATNAALERAGEPCALVVTAGFKDLLHIGNQSRPKIFDLSVSMPVDLYDHVVEINERVVLGKDDVERTEADGEEVTSSTGEQLWIRQAPNEDEVRERLLPVYERGIRSLAVLFVHSYMYPAHEQLVERVAKDIGFTQVSLSSHVMPLIKAVPRGYTAVADAYLTPHILRYVHSFMSGFADLKPSQVSFMQSDGGLAPVTSFSGHRAILSGPAGGVVGYALTTYPVERKPVVGFDMGGTSTDVSRFAGEFEHVYEANTAGVVIQAPQLDINTVAAGGGSRLFFGRGMFVVGPESAGAHPGPVCYRKGGHLAITDANLLLGRILPDHFPHIFGPEENEPLDVSATAAAFDALTEKVNAYYAETDGDAVAVKSAAEVAYGFIQVANEAMARPIRALTQMKGYDITTHVLACFGGAGGQHACSIARSLGMKTVFVHRFSGILSAYGIGLADVVQDSHVPTHVTVHHHAGEPEGDSGRFDDLVAKLLTLHVESRDQLRGEGFSEEVIRVELFLNLRYQGTDTKLSMPCHTARHDNDTDEAVVRAGIQAALQAFAKRYEREFGFTLPDRDVIADEIGGRAVATGTSLRQRSLSAATDPAVPSETAKIYFEGGWQDSAVYQLRDLTWGHVMDGPCMIIDNTSTILVEPNCRAEVVEAGDIRIVVGGVADAGDVDAALAETAPTTGHTPGQAIPGVPDASTLKACDPIQLAIFSHRFMGIAEQMGRTLQRTSISVNIKERLDFSCALFGPDGGLVANAPHIPVHLGAMQDAVRFQMEHWGADLRPGDVLVSNHPQLAGGSHLPDITVMTPVFVDDQIVFFVASRGHHADIGGIAPGSMPPLSKSLAEEGAAIVAFKLVDNFVFQDKGIAELLHKPGTLGIPGCVGTRNLKDCLSDLKAQVAANQRGIELVKSLIAEYDLRTVHSYMYHIQSNAETAVREMLKAFAAKRKRAAPTNVDVSGGVVVTARDQLDDGSPIQLRVVVDPATGGATFDFTGTGLELLGNLNAPPAVTYSAIIYSLRCLVGQDIPLNQGCLKPISIHVPSGTLLNPSAEAAVVGGNVLTSQRVVDVVLKAFGAAAASQGCMNNLTFGDAGMGYYETIAGGAGAGPTWAGRSGVHTHMTNTRITDPEILEQRYPVVLRQFSLREGSGGVGLNPGGEGVVRALEFRRPLTVSILSERRSTPPYGLAGGASGAVGRNVLKRAHASTVSVGSKNTFSVSAGDTLVIESPGGGGWGEVGVGETAQVTGTAQVLKAGGSLLQYCDQQHTN